MTNHKIISASFVLILLVASLSRCVKDVGKAPKPAAANCDTITYDDHIKPIMDKYCVSCHGDPLSGGAPINLNTYTSVKTSADNGTLKREVIDNATMPLGSAPLPQAEQDLITCWLNNGKIEKVAYNPQIKSLIDKYCVSCHGNPLSNGAPFALDSYTAVKVIADNGSLKRVVITDASMPKGGPPLPVADQQMIEFWLIHGKSE